MKLIRLTDDRYFLDVGEDISPFDMDAIKTYWKEWWEKSPGEVPEMFVVGGISVPVEYEDRRDADIEGRVAMLEAQVKAIRQREPE